MLAEVITQTSKGESQPTVIPSYYAYHIIITEMISMAC